MELTSEKFKMAENKIIMMYVLKKANRPISYKVFLELVTILSDINYFEFHELLKILLSDDYIIIQQENKKKERNIYNSTIDEANAFNQNFLKENIIEEKKEETCDEIKEDSKEKIELYILTKKGIEALKLALDILPGISKLRVDTNFNKYYKIIRESYSVSSEYLPKEDKVIFKIVEDEEEIFKMEIATKSVKQASNMMRNWKSSADEYYLYLIKELSKNFLDTDN